MLKYRCPKSGLEVTTGIATDPITLLDMRKMKLSLWCPHCYSSHQIPATAAYVDTPFAQTAE